MPSKPTALLLLVLASCSDEPIEVAVARAPVSSALASPAEKGPYQAAFTVFPATMTGGRTTRVHVYYPTNAAPDCASGYLLQGAAGTFTVSSPLCAVADAEVAPGAHPTIIYDHGGGAAGADPQRVSQTPVHELLASHGFIVVVALHSADAMVRIRDLALLLDLMLRRSADPADRFAGRVDADRVGASGFSAGAASSFNFAAGRASAGIASDPRIKALVVYEPGRGNVDLVDAANLSIPYLVMGGSQFVSAFFAPDLFAATTAAEPRVYVKVPGAIHYNFQTGVCDQVDDAREQALTADPALAEPLTVNLPGNAAAAFAWNQWNLGDTAPILALGPGFGGARNMCDRVGVDSIRSLDGDGDGFTDEPPLMRIDPRNPGPAVRAEAMIPLVQLYTVAFWKTFLAGDRRYMPFLTPGHARSQGLPTLVELAP